MTEGVSTGVCLESWRERVPDFSGCNAETWVPNEVRTNGADSRLMFETLGE